MSFFEVVSILFVGLDDILQHPVTADQFLFVRISAERRIESAASR